MKKILSTLLFISACIFALPYSTHAAGGTATQTSNGVVGNAFVAQYSVAQPPAVSAKVYLWVGEYDKTPAAWITQSQIIATLPTTTNGYPKTFPAQMDFTTLGVKPGIKYAYTIADKASTNSAFYFDVNAAESLSVKCFMTTGAVPCKTPAANPGLDSGSFELTPLAQQPDAEHAGKFITGFSIVSNVTLTASLPVTLKIFTDNGTTLTPLKQGDFPLPVGNGTTSVTINDLALGNYAAQLFKAATATSVAVPISGEVGWAVGATGPGGAKAAFDYVGLPSVSCDSALAICDFKIITNVTASGTLKFSLYGYPKTVFDGKPKVNGAELVTDPDLESVTIGQHETNFSMSFADIGAFTNAVDDPDFWFKFYEKQNDKNSDVGNTFSSSSAGVTFVPNANPVSDLNGFQFSGLAGEPLEACGSADGSNTPSLTTSSINLCSKGTSVEFNYDGFSYSWKCKGTDGTTVSCSATGGTDTNYGDGFLKNPLAPGLDTFPKIFAAVYNNIILPIAIPFIVIAIMYAGFKFVMARKEGGVDGYTDAKRILKYTLIGTALLLGGWVVANALQGTLNSLLGPETAKPTASTSLTKSLV